MPDEWAESQSLFEFRILRLEREGEDRELRVRRIENEIVQLNAKLDVLPKLVAAIDRLYDDRYKNLWAVIIATATVITSVIASHYFLPGVHQ
jgi:hypothetical protein